MYKIIEQDSFNFLVVQSRQMAARNRPPTDRINMICCWKNESNTKIECFAKWSRSLESLFWWSMVSSYYHSLPAWFLSEWSWDKIVCCLPAPLHTFKLTLDYQLLQLQSIATWSMKLTFRCSPFPEIPIEFRLLASRNASPCNDIVPTLLLRRGSRR